MKREIIDSKGITWISIQAYSGISHNAENQDATQVKGQEDIAFLSNMRCSGGHRA